MSIDARGYETRAVGHYMTAEEQPGGRWYVRMKRGGSMLGTITWYAPWKAFVFQPEELTEFSADCLRAISEFLLRLKDKKA